MEGRCVVDTWTQFGFSGARIEPKLLWREPHVFICDESNKVSVVNTKEGDLTAVLQFPAEVTDLDGHDQSLFVACASGVYCVNLQCLQDRAARSSFDASSGPAELKICSEHLVADADGASSLLLAGSVLLALGRRDSSWLLTLHKTHTRSSRSEAPGSLVLPMVSAAARGDTESGSRRRPVMICLHCGDATPPSSCSDSSVATPPRGHFCLEPVLFKLLFGVEAALAKSPVILCGLPDGRLVFVPLCLQGSKLRVLHSLEQPVVLVAASLTTEASPGRARCLVALGEHGRLVLIKADRGRTEDGGRRLGFTEACVSAPVACGCVDERCLYYSTGSDLLALDLSKRSSTEEDKGRDEETAAALQSPASLNVCRVIALAEPRRGAAGGVELLALSLSGRLQRIRLPLQDVQPGSNTSPSAPSGHSLKDVLAAIGDVCERASTLEGVIKSKNQTLKRLNQVISTVLLLAEERPPQADKPVRCHGRTFWSGLLRKPSLTLSCVLENSGPYVLERGWTLSVSVLPLSLPPSAGGQSPSRSFSFPLHRLSPGESLEVSLPVADAGDASFPLTVHCSLIFSLSSLFAIEGEGRRSGCVNVPLNTLTVDWLHGLQVNGPRPAHATAPFQSGAVTDGVSDFLNSYGGRCPRRPDRGGAPETYSASVRVSSGLLDDTLVVKTPETPRQGLCARLLVFLLSEGGGGVKRGRREGEPDLRGAAVHARGPNGAAVKLTAAEVHAGEDAPVTVRLQIESSSVAAVCGLHHAALCRIQTLLQRAPDNVSPAPVPSLELRRALQRAEMLQNRIWGALSAGTSAGHTNLHLLAVYRELRENPLLII